MFLRLDFQKLSHFRFIHKDNAKWCREVAEVSYCYYSRDSREIVLKFPCMEVAKFTDQTGRFACGPARTFLDAAPCKGLKRNSSGEPCIILLSSSSSSLLLMSYRWLCFLQTLQDVDHLGFLLDVLHFLHHVQTGRSRSAHIDGHWLDQGAASKVLDLLRHGG